MSERNQGFSDIGKFIESVFRELDTDFPEDIPIAFTGILFGLPLSITATGSKKRENRNIKIDVLRKGTSPDGSAKEFTLLDISKDGLFLSFQMNARMNENWDAVINIIKERFQYQKICILYINTLISYLNMG